MDFFHTHISPEALETVTGVLRSGWISEGQKVKEFEAALASQLGLCNPVALNSGTAALHLALALAGVKEGDEVILPAQTFVATGLVILMQKARPVFADIDPLTGNISPESVKAKITPKTRAIMIVHWGGYPCDLDEIQAIARRHNLALVEDAAHALGAAYKDQPLGSISRFTAFSFQAIKHLTTGDGGALCCTEADDARQALTRRWFGIDRANSRASILGEREYDITAVGYKYHMNELAAALGIANLGSFARRLERRRTIGAFYRRRLTDTPGLRLLKDEADRRHAYWLFTMLVEKRTDFLLKLAERGVPASVVHLRIDKNSVFDGAAGDLPGQQEFDECQISIPVHEGLRDEDLEHIVDTIRSGW